MRAIVAEEWLDGLGSPVRTFSYEYDALGRLLEASDPAATYTYDYDNLGRLIEEVQDIDGLTPTVTFASSYDVNSRRIELAASIGATADFLNEYLYDKLNRLTRLTQEGQSGNAVAEKRIDFEYEADGRFSAITRYADLAGTLEIATSDYSYDHLRRLTGLLHHKGMTDFAGYDYTYDVASQIAEIDSLIDGLTSYTHDFTGQLTGADHASQTDEAYEYDENGNRTMSGYDVDPNNLLMSDGTYNYEYDDEGNRTARVRISDGYRTEYEWDYRNRLVKITEEDDSNNVLSTVEHSYDYLNQWVRRVFDADGPVGGGLAVNTFMVHEDGQVVLQFDGVSGSDVQNRFLWGPSVDQILADEQVSSVSSAGNVIWPLTDHLNTTRDLVDRDEANGTVSVLNHREFDSFGTVSSETNAAVDHVFGFTGRYFDETTGLQNNVNRWYDAVVGQWVSEDPIGFSSAESNLRRYVRNDPTLAVDPTGLVQQEPPVIPGKTPIEIILEQKQWPSTVFVPWDKDSILCGPYSQFPVRRMWPLLPLQDTLSVDSSDISGRLADQLKRLSGTDRETTKREVIEILTRQSGGGEGAGHLAQLLANDIKKAITKKAAESALEAGKEFLEKYCYDNGKGGIPLPTEWPKRNPKMPFEIDSVSGSISDDGSFSFDITILR